MIESNKIFLRSRKLSTTSPFKNVQGEHVSSFDFSHNSPSLTKPKIPPLYPPSSEAEKYSTGYACLPGLWLDCDQRTPFTFLLPLPLSGFLLALPSLSLRDSLVIPTGFVLISVYRSSSLDLRLFFFKFLKRLSWLLDRCCVSLLESITSAFHLPFSFMAGFAFSVGLGFSFLVFLYLFAVGLASNEGRRTSIFEIWCLSYFLYQIPQTHITCIHFYILLLAEVEL